MRLKKILFVLLLFINLQICFGQEKAELVDEFGRIFCEDLQIRMQTFYADVKKRPDSVGYIYLYGNKDKPLEKYLFEISFKSVALIYKFDPHRIQFVQGKDKDSTGGQFWIVPSNVDALILDEEKWSYSLPDFNKPKKLYERQESLFADICPMVNSLYEELYSKILLGNPTFRGNIVISANSLKDFQKSKKELINEFVNNYKIPADRLRFFNDKNGYQDNVEFWIVPTKRK